MGRKERKERESKREGEERERIRQIVSFIVLFISVSLQFIVILSP